MDFTVACAWRLATTTIWCRRRHRRIIAVKTKASRRHSVNVYNRTMDVCDVGGRRCLEEAMGTLVVVVDVR